MYSRKNIDDFDSLFSSKESIEVKMIDSTKLERTSDFLKLDNLEILIVLGTSYFIGGSLNALKGKLEVFNYENKRHYNIKHEDFKTSYLIQNAS